MTFFLDENLPPFLAATLTGMGFPTCSIHDRPDGLSPGMADDHWLMLVAQRGWVPVTRDARTRRSPSFMASVKRHGVRMFVVRGGQLSGADLTKILVNRIDDIATLIERQAGPFVAHVSRRSVRVDRSW